MTFKALMSFGGLQQDGPPVPIMDRYHHGGHHGGHHSGWHGYKKGGGNSGAALSALTLLAFLFLMNVMQQSLQENNATETTTATTIFLRENQQPIALKSSEDVSDGSVMEKEVDSNKKEQKKETMYIKIRKPTV